MGVTTQLKESWQDMEQPLEFEGYSFLKKGKLRIIIIFEDGSSKDYFQRFGQSYFFTIKKRKYLIVPDAIVKGKNATLIYYFNNPFPVKFIYENTQMSAIELYDKDMRDKMPIALKTMLANTMIDGEVLRAAFDSNFLQNMYYQRKITMKAIIIIVLVVFVIILVILQLTGVVDIMGALQSG